jgi:hypothetical protein
MLRLSGRSAGIARVALVVVLCAVDAGCYSFAVRSENDRPSAYQGRTVHSYLWSLVEMDPVVVAANCGSEGISAVRAKTNYLFMAAGILSLGLWVPMTVEWRCAEAGRDTP